MPPIFLAPLRLRRRFTRMFDCCLLDSITRVATLICRYDITLYCLFAAAATLLLLMIAACC